MSESSHNSPLAELERRWGDERSPQLTLHLAEEHRRLGNLARALEIVGQGLEHHPGHIAARVALGRFLFEDGRVAEAIEALESVVYDDPTHLVANKLLVSACLEVGEHGRARDRLALYTTLNASDPDIEALEEKLEEAGREATAAQLGGTRQDDEATITEQRPDVSASPSRDPFGEFWSPEDQAACRSALVGEGIFQLLDFAQDDKPKGSQPEVAESTVTLGGLYLEQGHVDEAASIFRAVLEKEPDNADAQAGLREAMGADKELQATDLVAPEALAAVGSRQRKIMVLESYRSRVRAASAKG